MHSKFIQHFLFCAIAFLLPLQTQYLLHIPKLIGEDWQYGRFGIYVLDILILGVIVFSAASKKRISDTQQQLLIALAVFVGALLITSVFHNHIKEHWFMVLRFIEGLLFVWAFVKSDVPFRRVLLWFVFGMTIVSLFGIWQFAVQRVPESVYLGVSGQVSEDAGVSIVSSYTGRFLRAYGTLPHPNVFGGFIALALLALAWLVLRYTSEQRKHAGIDALWIIAGVIFVAALLCSFSRSSWLGVAAGITVLLIATIKLDKKKFFAVWMKAILIVVIFSSIVSSIFFPLLKERVSFTDPHEVVSVEDRVRSTNDSWEILKSNWWKGVGLSRFTFYINDEIEPGREDWQLQPVHNIFLLLASEASVFSAALFIMLLVLVISDSVSAMKKTIQKVRNIPHASFGLAAIVMMIVIGMFDAYFISLPPGVFLMFFALALAIRAIGEDQEEAMA